jgi:hypothetical protein
MLFNYNNNNNNENREKKKEEGISASPLSIHVDIYTGHGSNTFYIYIKAYREIWRWSLGPFCQSGDDLASLDTSV